MRLKDPQTERMILYLALGHASKNAQRYILKHLKKGSFGTDAGKEIYKRFILLQQRNVPLPSITEFLADPALTENARTFLKTPPEGWGKDATKVSQQRVDDIIEVLRKYRKLRVLHEGIDKVSKQLKGSIDEKGFQRAETTLDTTLQELRKAEGQNITVFGAGTTKKDVQQLIKKHTTYDPSRFISTGLDGLDTHAGGFARGELVVVYATRGAGKTLLGMQMGINQFRRGASVGFVSIEMEEEDLVARILANVTGKYVGQIRSKEGFTDAQRTEMANEFFRFSVIEGNKRNCRLVILDSKGKDGYTPYQMEMEIAPYAFDSVIIDYLTLFDPGDKKLWEAQKDYARYLKNMARRLGCVVIVLAQLNKDGDVKYGKGPEEDADMLIRWERTDEFKETGKVDLELAKSRHAKYAKIPAVFRQEIMRVDTWEPESGGMSRYNTSGSIEDESWDIGN